MSDGPETVSVSTEGNESEGEEFTLTCTADGRPEPQYQWIFNDTDIAGETENQLILLLNYTHHDGEYVCKAENDVGDATSDPVPVYVKCKYNVFNVSYI